MNHYNKQIMLFDTLMPIIIIGNLVQAQRIVQLEYSTKEVKLINYSKGNISRSQNDVQLHIYYGTDIDDDDIDNSNDITYVCNLKTETGYNRVFNQLLSKFCSYPEEKRTWRHKLSNGYAIVTNSKIDYKKW